LTSDAIEQLKKEGATDVLNAVLEALDNTPEFSAETAGQIIKQVTKQQKVKKGLVMRSLRAGLTGDVHGPDLMESWVLLHQKGQDKSRLQQALSQV